MINYIQRKRNKKGFTLIELVVVVAIIGILAAIAIPRFANVTTDADKSAHNANVRTLESAANLWLAEEGLPAAETTWTGDNEEAWKDYLQAWPDPVGKRAAYKVTIATNGEITVSPPAE